MTIEPRWLALLLAPVVIRAVQMCAVGRYAKTRHGKLIFGAPGLVGLCAVGFLLGMAIWIGGWYQGARTTTTVIGGALAAAALLLWPPTLVLEETGLRAVYVWRPTKYLGYGEIEYASKCDHEINVVGKKKEIKHTQYHVDSGRFLAELRKHGINT